MQIPYVSASSRAFQKEKPGRCSLRAFRRRRADRLSFANPLSQESSRLPVIIADSLSTHFDIFDKLITMIDLDNSRIFSLDEVGFTSDKEINGCKAARRLMPRKGTCDMRMPKFLNLSGLTMKPVISAI